MNPGNMIGLREQSGLLYAEQKYWNFLTILAFKEFIKNVKSSVTDHEEQTTQQANNKWNNNQKLNTWLTNKCVTKCYAPASAVGFDVLLCF